jgi:Zn-dependent protease
MTDPLTWSPINLGRWAGVPVRLHIALVVFVVVTLLSTAIGTPARLDETACWLGLLLLALAVHELGHALIAAWMGAEPDEVHLWPLGNMVGPITLQRSGDHVLVALAGPAFSAAVVLASAIALNLLDAQFVWNPFGNSPKAGQAFDSGAPILNATGNPATPYTPAWWIGWFGYLNWVILLANLLPALPFDNGRILRAYLAQVSLSPTKDGLIPPLLARSCVIILTVAGLIRLFPLREADGLTLIGLALLIEWMVRLESRLIEDGGYFDDGVFGYDFSEGYTSLEAGTAKVRPYRENALKRWRRRRSELRRQRRAAQEAAEERRMDEILDKIHRLGRAGLTEEENRFLVRVSARYRNRTRD